MKFRTIVDIPKLNFKIEPSDKLLCVGSCFASNIGKRFECEGFDVIVNPYGMMYNPISVYHTIESINVGVDCAIITLGTNHVYVEKSTSQVVDNCNKRPQYLFDEQILDISTCVNYLIKAIDMILERNEKTKIMLTVSPIRYAKYGFHESQLSKSVLLLAADEVVKHYQDNNKIGNQVQIAYFPAYEIINDELRDYRFYQEDMLHPTDQAVSYIWEKLLESFCSTATLQYINTWKPIKEGLNHRPFNADSKEYKDFLENLFKKLYELKKSYPHIPIAKLKTLYPDKSFPEALKVI